MKKEITLSINRISLFIALMLCFFSTKSPAQTTSLLPMLEMNKTRFDFGKVEYLETKKDTISFTNVGDTTLLIYHIDSLQYPFLGTFIYPDTILVGDSIKFELAYRPTASGKDSQRVFLRADTRLSHSIALLFDVSSSMLGLLYDGVQKITASKNAGIAFINSMLLTPKIWDEAAVYSFADDFYVEQDYTTDKAALIKALTTNTRSSTAFYDACAYSINLLKKRSFKKVLVAMTDGEDNESHMYTYTQVISLAKANDIKIYTVGVGSATADGILRSIAESTGGQFFKATTSKQLTDIYYKIFSLLTKNITMYFDVLGECGAPKLYIECPQDTSLPSGKEVEYKFYLKPIAAKSIEACPYTFRLKFNSTVLYPIGNFPDYKFDGVLEMNGSYTSGNDSLPLTTIKFKTLLGNERCTDITVEPLIWADDRYSPIDTKGDCRICIDECFKAPHDIALRPFLPSYMHQNAPNPCTEETEVNLDINFPGLTYLYLYDMMGRRVKTINEKWLEAGHYSLSIDMSDLYCGQYILIFRNMVQDLSIVIQKE